MKGSLWLKLNLFLIFTAILMIVAIFIFDNDLNLFARAINSLPDKEIEIIGSEPYPEIVEIKPFKNIIEKIEEGKNILHHSPPLVKSEKWPAKREISLAILDTKTGEVFEQRYWLSEEELNKPNKSSGNLCGRENLFPHFQPQESNRNLSIIVKWWNSHNSNLIVSDPDCEGPERYIVVANKALIPNSYLVYPQDRTGKKYSDIIYTPYSESLHREETINEGLNFLNEKVALAFDQMRESKIKSRAFPDKLINETIRSEFVKSIFINEQSDPTAMITSPDGGKRVAERMLVRLGVNKDTAFRYTYSSVGALGLGQIMPNTYLNIVRDYPEARLIKDEGIGRADVLNSIKASILVFDDHFAAVVRRAGQSSKTQALLDQKNEKEIEDIRAAIYNGGPGKYQSLTGTISLAIPETVSFLMKLNLIRELDLFN